MTHSNSSAHETYKPESIADEIKKGNSQEAARELNRDLHGAKDFNSVYQKVNAQIDRINSRNHLNLPHIELVDGSGQAVGAGDKSKVSGIKIDNTTYGTDTVRNNTITDKATGGKTVNASDGTSKSYDMNNNQVEKTQDGGSKTTYKIPEAHHDKEIGDVKSAATDAKGNQILTSTDGNTKTEFKDGRQTIDWAKPSDHKDSQIGNVTQESTDTKGNHTYTAADGTTKTVSKDGGQTIHWAKPSDHKDSQIGAVAQESVDAQGKHTYSTADGTTKTFAKDGNQVIKWKNGDRDINHADGSGERVQRWDGKTHIHSWSKTDPKGNYDVIIKADGSYQKWGDSLPNRQVGTHYQLSEDEK